MDYSSFGTVLDESSTTNGDRMTGSAGLERDTVTGLSLAVERVENPGTGRWGSQDPMEFGGGDADLYRYVANDPVGFTDSWGLDIDQENLDQFWDRLSKLLDIEVATLKANNTLSQMVSNLQNDKTSLWSIHFNEPIVG